MADVPSALGGWERAIEAAREVQERLLRATAALDAAGVSYAVIGDNAVRAWVARVDDSAVQSPPIVELLLRRADLPAAEAALLQVGFEGAPPQPEPLRYGHVGLCG